MNGANIFAGQPVLIGVVLSVAAAAAVRGVWSPCGLSMISAINPFTERSRGHRYWATAVWFIAGSVVGGALLGLVAALGAAALMPLPVEVALIAAIACCVFALAADSPRIAVRLPNHPRQVNEQWLARYRRWIYAAGFGLQIGCGFATYIMTAAVYLTVVLGALSGSPAFALATGLTFGLVRGLAVLLSSAARTPARLQALHCRLDVLAPWSLRAVMLVVSLAAVAFGLALAGVVGGAVVLLVVVAGAVVRGAARPSRREVPVASCSVDVGSSADTVAPMSSHTAQGESPSWGEDSVRAAGRRSSLPLV